MKVIDRIQYISQPSKDGSQLTAIHQALDAGSKWIQLRVKNESAKSILQHAIAAKKLCERYEAKLIVNDYPEIAVEVNAEGVHLGLDDMPIFMAREIVGAEMIIGGTANTFGHVQQRVAEGADYIGLGPFRFTKTKVKLSPVLALEGYQRIFGEMKKVGLEIPVVAIGGILAEDIPSLMAVGAYGVAISGAITFSESREEIIQLIIKQQKAYV
ncbi:MAG: thiamine phosphate synthase [Pedobacter sp.]|nr:MAG: thiamine phosphate synthase [Pedobacter sp.]